MDIFNQQDSAQIMQRLPWHKIYQAQTYDFGYLLGINSVPNNLSSSMDRQPNHTDQDQMDDQNPQQDPYESQSPAQVNSGFSLSPLDINNRTVFSPLDINNRTVFSRSRKKKDQKYQDPYGAARKHGRDYICQQIRNSQALGPDILESMKQRNLLTRSQKSDKTMCSYLGAIGYCYGNSPRCECLRLKNIRQRVKQRITIVKTEHTGRYSEYGDAAEKWMNAFCIAIDELIEMINNGQTDDRVGMVKKMLQTYYKLASNKADRKRQSDIRNNSKAYQLALKQ